MYYILPSLKEILSPKFTHKNPGRAKDTYSVSPLQVLTSSYFSCDASTTSVPIGPFFFAKFFPSDPRSKEAAPRPTNPFLAESENSWWHALDFEYIFASLINRTYYAPRQEKVAVPLGTPHCWLILVFQKVQCNMGWGLLKA